MKTNEEKLSTKALSSLVKVFPDSMPGSEGLKQASVFKNETYSFQIAYYLHRSRKLDCVRIKVHSKINEFVSIRSVGLVPSELPCYPDHDEHILRGTPGLFPDPLIPYEAIKGISIAPHQWRSIWVTVESKGSIAAGRHPVSIAFETPQGEQLAEETMELEVIPIELPEQRVIHTEWMHTDCIAQFYNVEVFSEDHWKRIEQYMGAAAQHGINMILTPLFTPPLDTKIGGERLTTQLVGVNKEDRTYTFDFELLKRWVEVCNQQGITYLEFAHLFTQWGAKHAPKILAVENGELKQIFGWETDATGEEYKDFLAQFLPRLVEFIKENQLNERVYFHISDEPKLDDLPWYRSASQIIQKHLGEFPIIDALSDIEFYERGLVKTPIPSNDKIETFLEKEIPERWTYYCCQQYQKVSNRFFDMPSIRNRIIGIQMYKYNIMGFLHWGLNFWNSQFSINEIDPFQVTDASLAFPSGDAFLVYPGNDGPISSIRFEVLREAFQDIRALNLLEELIGRDQVLSLLDAALEQEITFDSYPLENNLLLDLREKINRMIEENDQH